MTSLGGSNIASKVNEDGSDRLIHNVQRGRKGTQNGIGRVLGYQGLFFGSSSRGSFYGGSAYGMCTGHNHERLHFFERNLQGKALPKSPKIRHPYHDAVQSS